MPSLTLNQQNSRERHVPVRCSALLDLMITADRTPINRQTAKQLSRGTGRVQTVEEAMRILTDYLSRAGLCDEMRQAVDAGAAYCITIKVQPTWKAKHGISVELTQCLKTSTPGNHAKLFYGELV